MGVNNPIYALNAQEKTMTQHKDKVKQRKIEMDKEKLNETVVNYEYQRGADVHYRKITYASGRVVTTDLKDKD